MERSRERAVVGMLLLIGVWVTVFVAVVWIASAE